jgi:hypothetical protein
MLLKCSEIKEKPKEYKENPQPKKAASWIKEGIFYVFKLNFRGK